MRVARTNPVYRKEWWDKRTPKFKRGDRVVILYSIYEGKTGIVDRCYYSILEDRIVCDVRFRPQISVSDIPANIPEAHLQLDSSFQENPVYTKEWRHKGPIFRKGDVVRVVPHMSIYSKMQGRVGVVQRSVDVPGGVWYPTQYVYRIKFKKRHTDPHGYPQSILFKEHELRLVKRFQYNPVFPKEWRDPLFKIGERVRISLDSAMFSHRGATGTIMDIDRREGVYSEATLPENYFYTVQIDNSTEYPLFYGYELERIYSKNPVYPKEWSQPKFKAGSRVRVVSYPKSFSDRQYVGSTGTVIGIDSRETEGRIWYIYDVKLDTFPAARLFLGGELEAVYSENPVFPKEWRMPAKNAFVMLKKVYVPHVDLEADKIDSYPVWRAYSYVWPYSEFDFQPKDSRKIDSLIRTNRWKPFRVSRDFERDGEALRDAKYRIRDGWEHYYIGYRYFPEDTGIGLTYALEA